MPNSRHWTAPPTRREIMLLLFSLTVFVLSYNLEASLGLVGVDPQKVSYLSGIGLSSQDPGFDADGRRPKPHRDELEDIIVGDWEWREGEVSGASRGHSASSGSGALAVIYNFGSSRSRKIGADRRDARKGDRGVSLDTGVTVKDQFVKWGKEVPQTQVVAHTPGFTILDNVVALNGTLFIVADDWTKVPKLSDIASSSLDPTKSPRIQDWQLLTPSNARLWFGPYASKIHGTSWIALDSSPSQDPYTLLSLFRTHASLASSPPSSSFTSPSGLHIISPSSPAPPASAIPAPLRLLFPHIPTFSSPHIPPGPGEDEKAHPPPRERSSFGVHPLLPKTVLPTLGLWFEEDWADLKDMHVPFLFERVVVADRGAAERGRARWLSPSSSPSSSSSPESPAVRDGAPAWAAPFVGLNAPDRWWAPARAALLRFLHVPDASLSALGRAGSDQGGRSKAKASEAGGFWGTRKEARDARPVVTYVSMQDEPRGAGARLAQDAHARLVDGLRQLEREGVLGEVHVVRGNGSVSMGTGALEWEARMRAIARSTIVLGPYGHQLADGVFMRTVPAGSAGKAETLPPVLMEFFPPGTFVRDQEYAMQALGIDYVAWWNERRFSGSSLPSVISHSSPPGDDPIVPIDVDAVLRAVREEAPRRVA